MHSAEFLLCILRPTQMNRNCPCTPRAQSLVENWTHKHPMGLLENDCWTRGTGVPETHWRSRRENTSACKRQSGRLCWRGDLPPHMWKMNRSFAGKGGGNSRNREQVVQRQWGVAQLLCPRILKSFNIFDKYVIYYYWSINHKEMCQRTRKER